MKIDDRHRQEFSKLGVTTIHNALAEQHANNTIEQFSTADFDHIQQKRRGYFKRAIPLAPQIPSEDEIHTSDFQRSQFLENGDFLKSLYENQVKPIIEYLSGEHLSRIELRAYKMDTGGHFRTHIDDYLGSVGFIWYLSRNWKWDWGGLLITIDGENATATIPKFNQLVIINHGAKRLPHLVSEVYSCAQQPRYMLVGFAC